MMQVTVLLCQEGEQQQQPAAAGQSNVMNDLALWMGTRQQKVLFSQAIWMDLAISGFFVCSPVWMDGLPYNLFHLDCVRTYDDDRFGVHLSEDPLRER